jgi:hypothetical protein
VVRKAGACMVHGSIQPAIEWKEEEEGRAFEVNGDVTAAARNSLLQLRDMSRRRRRRKLCILLIGDSRSAIT